MEMEEPRRPDGFVALGLEPAVARAVAALGYEEPTAIQREAIPPLLAGRDVLGQAATGTGKTAAFALPLLQRVVPREPGAERPVRALILVPTRELAMQVAEAVATYGKALGARATAVYGGQSFSLQVRALRRGVDVVIATPGRALDHLRRGTLSFERVEMLVLDEADEMLDMGFADELEALLAAAPAERQTALFSATMAPRIGEIAARHLRDPVRVTVAADVRPVGEAPLVREVAYAVPRAFKPAALLRVLELEAVRSAIAFCRTRIEVDEITEALVARGYDAAALHGGLSQEQRDRVLRKFRDGDTALLVATDVAARGLDIDRVTHVLNVDVPASPDAYTHRIGRTGRAGRTGTAITLADPREFRLVQNIERVTKRTLAFEDLPTLARLQDERIARARATFETALADGELERYREAAREFASERDAVDVVAAALALLVGQREAAVPDVDIPRVEPPSAPRPKRPFVKRDIEPRPVKTAPAESPAPAPRVKKKTSEETLALPAEPKAKFLKPRAPGGTRFARLYVGVGKNGGVRPADLTGAIANEANLRSRDIGKIEVAGEFSIVEVPEEAIERVIVALRRTKIRGIKAEIRRDRGRAALQRR